MTIPNIFFPPTKYHSTNYDIDAKFSTKYTYIKIAFVGAHLHTCDFVATIPVLKKYLPGIFTSTCFNENGFSFAKEVQDTEMGHLFEHILLEYLCEFSKGGDGVFRGETKWNWQVDPRGVFHIYLSSTAFEVYAFKKALAKAIELINKIIGESKAKPVAVYIPTN